MGNYFTKYISKKSFTNTKNITTMSVSASNDRQKIPPPSFISNTDDMFHKSLTKLRHIRELLKCNSTFINDIQSHIPYRSKIYEFVKPLGIGMVYVKRVGDTIRYKSKKIHSSVRKNKQYYHCTMSVKLYKKNQYDRELVDFMMMNKLAKMKLYEHTHHVALPPVFMFKADVADIIKLGGIKITKSEYRSCAFVTIHEGNTRGCFRTYMSKYSYKCTDDHYKTFIFQLISAIIIMRCRFPQYKIDLTSDRSLMLHKIDRKKRYNRYKIQGLNYKVPNVGYHIKLRNIDEYSLHTDNTDNTDNIDEMSMMRTILDMFENILLESPVDSDDDSESDHDIHKKFAETKRFIDRMTVYMHKNKNISLNAILICDSYFADCRENFDIAMYEKIKKYSEMSINI